ncbi:MAG TPA: heme lyase CcmF/NrfE family subunit [Steroidobacteraceae bacterium]|nr:heme lyase CcmF/NrfE family subunit [Steroidobacteraceae bacterium]
MIPELGHLALILALCLAIAQAGFGLAGAHWRRADWIAVVRPAVAGQFVFLALAFGCLVTAFLQHDFSVAYVAQNSNSALPAYYRVAAVWGAHEGSLLLWIVVLSIWSLAVAAFSRALPTQFLSRVLGVLGLVSAGFMSFTLATSNPFLRLQPAVAEGNDLNPLLQDFALTVHPPILYTGYVGFAVAFAFACAAMLEGKLDQSWARWTRPWTTVAWLFLTVGISLGSWWAYYELGWGGWWFWDPVENASFMPWLVGTALIHSLAVTEKRGLFKSWTLLLAIFAFSLSLLGTFLVRSGVLVSVHAFASDPARGLFILIFLTLCIGGALALYAWRAPKLASPAGFELWSRESFLLFNNILFVIAAALILLGTLYPLFMDALDLGKLSVGPPYFTSVFVVPMLPLLALLGVGMHASWKRARLAGVKRPLLIALALALVISLTLTVLAYGRAGVLTVVGFTAGLWVMFSALREPLSRLRHRQTLSAAVLGMSLAHFGVGLFTIAVTAVESYKVEKDLAMKPGDSTEVEGYRFTFDGLRDLTGPNYNAVEGQFTITRGSDTVAVLHPQKRVYRVQTSPMTEAGIAVGWTRDLFVALGDDLGNDAWSVRLQYKPLIRYIWLGAWLMALGGLVATTDRRYRLKRVPEQAPATGGAMARESG